MAATSKGRRNVPESGDARRSWRRITPGGAFTALAAVLVAGVAARDAAVFVMAQHYPTIALKLAPANATAIVKVFDRALTSGEVYQNFPGWLAASKQALRADPLNAKGLRLLAYATETTTQGQKRAATIMRLSERTSRRDLLAQIWLIEHAVRREDITDALKHYDRALSVHPAAGGDLIPVLVSASTQPEIQNALVPYLRANRPWAVPFLSVAIAKAPGPAAKLFERYGGARVVPSHAELETRLLQRLVESSHISEARSFALAAGASSDSFTFSRATTDARFRPLNWTLYDGSDGEVSLGDRGALSINVRPETKIVAASRTILARPGPQVLTQRVFYPDASATPLVTWKAYCRRVDGPERFWTRDIPLTATPTLIKAPITIPQGCAGVQIDLEATGSNGPTESRVSIDQVDLAAR